MMKLVSLVDFIFPGDCIFHQVWCTYVCNILGHDVGNSLHVGKGETGKEQQSKRKDVVQKAHTHSALETDLVSSMSHEHHLCLYSKDRKKLTTHKKGFAACVSYTIWMTRVFNHIAGTSWIMASIHFVGD
jgi:hypothetical protein